MTEFGTRYFTWTCALDNHEPVRQTVKGRGKMYDTETAREQITLLYSSFGARCGVILDDGHKVTPYYLVGSNEPDHDITYWQTFPLSEGTRPDNGRPIDMSGWMLGPRRTFHLKVEWDD